MEAAQVPARRVVRMMIVLQQGEAYRARPPATIEPSSGVMRAERDLLQGRGRRGPLSRGELMSGDAVWGCTGMAVRSALSRIGASLAVAAAAAAPSIALADPALPPEHAGPYVAVDLGYHWPLTIDATSFSPAPDGRPFEWRYSLNSDWAAFGRAGWRFSPHFRVELDAGLREGNIHAITSPGTGLNGLSVQRPQTPFQLCDLTGVPPPCARIGRPHVNWDYADNGLVNAIYDIAPNHRLDPFVGVGAGIYHLQFDAHYYFSAVPGPIGPTNPAVQTIQLGGSILRPTQFAYQAVGGVSYRLKRKLWFDVTYRYIDAPFLRWNTLNDTPGLTQSQGLEPHDFHGDTQDMSVTFGLRYALR